MSSFTLVGRLRKSNIDALLNIIRLFVFSLVGIILLVRDRMTWERIIQQGEGYIYNDFGTQFPGNSPTWNTKDFNKLHRASCPQVRKMTYVTEEKLTKHFFKTKQEAIDWLKENRKEDGYTFCHYCNP